MLRLLSFLTLLTFNSLCFGQADSANYHLRHKHSARWQSLGVNYDAINSLYGMMISNGLDEQPLIHFEDIPAKWLYKFQGQSDFKNDYSVGIKLSRNYLQSIKPFYLVTVEFFQRDLASSIVFQRDVYLSTGLYFLKNYFIIKAGHQTLDTHSNFGIGLGIQKYYYPRLYGGFILTYHFDYGSFSFFLQSFLIRNKLGLRITYDKISKYDFLNLGLHFSFKK
jgi:hypothetical protein